MGGFEGKNPEYKGDNLVRTVLSILVDVSSVGFAGEGVKKALLNKALSTLIKSTGDVTAADVLEVVVIVHASFLVNNAVWDAAKGAEHLGYKCEQTEVAFVAGDVTGVTPGKNVRPWTASVVSPQIASIRNSGGPMASMIERMKGISSTRTTTPNVDPSADADAEAPMAVLASPFLAMG